VNRQWVINASPLIAIAKISLIHLLPEMCGDLVIPAGVVREINSGPEDDPARIWLGGVGVSYIREVEPINPIIAAWDLGLGETHVISWAYENSGYEAVIDDRAAKNAANSLKISVRGTLGIILLAKQEGRLSRVKPFLEQLVQIGFRVSPAILTAVLQLANE
jgi:predicted nucleic acid-binding protein